ncbi:MAG TPA: hypothetical protein VGH62_16130 [Bradyrhizobium sp.]|jgi:hypothetical protein
MDWIEKLLGISPDGGDGSTELWFAVAVGFIVLAVLVARFPKFRAALRQLFAKPTISS